MTLFEFIFNQRDESKDWTITRLRALEERPIGPRYPTGLFTIYNPHNNAVGEGE
jgi:hypothetical protein